MEQAAVLAPDPNAASDKGGAYLTAIGRAYREAVQILDKRYVIDETARAKLMGIVVRVARGRLRFGQTLSEQRDVETLTRLAVQHFLRLKSAAPSAKESRVPLPVRRSADKPMQTG